jgi:hypothetical protein
MGSTCAMVCQNKLGVYTNYNELLNYGAQAADAKKARASNKKLTPMILFVQDAFKYVL